MPQPVLEAVIFTAQSLEESLQAVTVAVNAFSGARWTSAMTSSRLSGRGKSAAGSL
jgi:hypothetical protein